MSPLVIASHNEGKVREIGELLAPFRLEVVSAASLRLPEPEETGATFEENAMLKSKSAAALSGKWSLADDSGLCVKALNDAPGIYSARWAGPGKDFGAAIKRIRTELEERRLTPEGQEAFFICVLALSAPNGETMAFEGKVTGTLTFPPRGDKGFGYDPIFVPLGRQQTFAEMDASAKHAISHRAHAFEKFAAHLRSSGEAS